MSAYTDPHTERELAALAVETQNDAPPADEMARLKLCVQYANDTTDAAIEQVHSLTAERDAALAREATLKASIEADRQSLRFINSRHDTMRAERDAANARAERLEDTLHFSQLEQSPEWPRFIAEKVRFLRSMHARACFENGDHKDECDTAYSLGADALERVVRARAALAQEGE